MDSSFSLFKFVFNPAFALVCAILFSALAFHYRKTAKRRNRLLITAAAWAPYAAWEAYVSQWRSPTGDMAIRVDIVYIVPIMLIITLLGIMALIPRR